jgi:hypothetical protein
VVITPEKQIVMILVPKAIKDKVIESIYKEVGINTKGQGIAFSFPAAMWWASSIAQSPQIPLQIAPAEAK